jgi:formate dehydrogenase assembly factor FdhD
MTLNALAHHLPPCLKYPHGQSPKNRPRHLPGADQRGGFAGVWQLLRVRRNAAGTSAAGGCDQAQDRRQEIKPEAQVSEQPPQHTQEELAELIEKDRQQQP